MGLTAKQQAKTEAIEEITSEVKNSGVENVGMASFVVGVQTMMAIDVYEKKLTENLGEVISLLEALGNTVTENGSPLTDSITFQNLKKRLSDET